MQNINLDSIFKNSSEICEDIQENVHTKKIILALLLIIFICSGLYGLTMGFSHSWEQSISSLIKVPSLYLLTLLVCVPTLHFAGLFLGSKVSFYQSTSILLLGIATNSAFLLGFTTISIFFVFTGSGYKFLLLMHVLFFIIGGVAGLISIYRSYTYLSNKMEENPKAKKTLLLKIWMILYMFVGTQMAYILSPFVGKEKEFYLFHNTQGNFYSYLVDLTLNKFEDQEIKSKDAENLIADKARIAINSLNEKNIIRLSSLVGNEGLKVILGSIPVFYGSERIDPVFTSAKLIESFEKDLPVTIGQKESKKDRNKYDNIDIPFSKFYSKYIFTEDLEYQKIEPNFNEFTVGKQNKEKLREYYPKAIFVEYPKLNNDGSYSVLRLIFNDSTSGYYLVAILNDKSE